MLYHIGRYSKLIRPFSYVVDLFVINFFITLFFENKYETFQDFYLNIYASFVWLVISYHLNFYEIYRYTKPVKILNLIFKQSILYFLIFCAFPTIFNENLSSESLIYYVFLAFLSIFTFKFLLYFLLKKYRVLTGSNYRNTVILGYNKETKALSDFFKKRTDIGYNFLGFFSDKKDKKNEIQGNLSDSFNFILKNNVDEVYCSIKELSNEKIKEIIDFCDLNLKVLKFIPDNKDIFTKELTIDYYEYLPILSLRDIALDDPFNKVLKRGFDIIFSLFVILFFLSWLVPLIAIIIRLESKGPVFFKQSRPGLNEKEFLCYKFRSMRINNETEKSATKDDPRVTKVGAFIRKTSLDELPQFYNVLFGNMSIVGPRPHLWRQNAEYGNKVNKYMVRHFVKPGITGLAQTRGFRGEIETRDDIINRIKYDVFYIENWSLLLDLKIIIQTVLNILKGEAKAY